MQWESTLLLEAITEKSPQLTHSPFPKMWLQADLVMSPSLSSIDQLITSLDIRHADRSWAWCHVVVTSQYVAHVSFSNLLLTRCEDLSLPYYCHRGRAVLTMLSDSAVLSASSSLITVSCFCSQKGSLGRWGPVLYFLGSATCLIRPPNWLTWSQLHSQACTAHCSLEYGKYSWASLGGDSH